MLGPLLQATLNADQILSDSLYQADNSGKLKIIFDKELNNFNADSLYTIPDTTINTLYVWPFIPFNVGPGTPFFSNNKNLVLSINGAQLTAATLKKGTIRLIAKNTLPTRVYFTYTITEARKNNIPLSITRSVASGSISYPAYFTEDIDFSGYQLNLTGATHNLVNTLAYNVLAKSDSAGPSINVVQGDTMLNISAQLIGVSPSYVRGYLGQKTISVKDSLKIGFGKLFSGGQLLLDSAKLNLDIENFVGADLQTYISGITSINNRTGVSIPLSAPSALFRNLDISRATETGSSSNPVNPVVKPIVLDNSNSNLTSFLQNLPDHLETDLRFNVNPLGNISGSNDFIYSDRIIKTHARLEIPVRAALLSLSIRDTQQITVSDFTSLDPIGPSTVTLVADNGFPIEVKLQLYLLDGNKSVTDSLLIPNVIPAGSLGPDLRVNASTTTRINITIDNYRKQNLIKAKFIAIRSSFTTTGAPQLLDFYEEYRLKLQLLFDGTYHIQ